MWLKVMLVFKNLDATYDLLLGKKGRKLAFDKYIKIGKEGLSYLLLTSRPTHMETFPSKLQISCTFLLKIFLRNQGRGVSVRKS